MTAVAIIIGGLFPILIAIALLKSNGLRGYWVTFEYAPSFTRINSAYEKGTRKHLNVKLSDGQTHTSKPQDDGTFIQMGSWAITVSTPNHRALEMVIPDKTPTDFASIPRFLHPLINPLTNNIYAAVLHDYIYRNPANSRAGQLSKTEADALLFAGMRACGVGKLTAAVIYMGVVIGGKSSYKR